MISTDSLGASFCNDFKTIIAIELVLPSVALCWRLHWMCRKRKLILLAVYPAWRLVLWTEMINNRNVVFSYTSGCHCSFDHREHSTVSGFCRLIHIQHGTSKIHISCYHLVLFLLIKNSYHHLVTPCSALVFGRSIAFRNRSIVLCAVVSSNAFTSTGHSPSTTGFVKI